MAEDRTDPLADLFTLFATPLSGTVRSLEQFRKGVDEFLKGVENFNRTMANLNESSERINSLLADVEEPIRAAIPQVTRTVKAADEMMQVVSGPAMAVAPGLNRLAETLSTPAFAQLPNQIGQFSEVLGEISHRLSPLTQLAESAGGLFGGFRVPGMRPTPPADAAPERSIVTNTTRRPAPEASAPEVSAPEPATRTTATKKTTAKKSTGRKTAAKKSTAKKSTGRKTAAKKTTAKKTTAKKSTGRKAAAKKTTAKKTAPKRGSAASSSPSS
ncbi:MAG: histone H1-like repetitive region-containing protein [Ilumatobacteraceae bacterium]|jgi:hypothetical protein